MAKEVIEGKQKKTNSNKSQKTDKNNDPVKVDETPQVSVPEVKETAKVSVIEEPTIEIDQATQLISTTDLEESNTEILFNKLINQFQDIQLVMKTLHGNLKLLQKEVLKERKESKKKESKIKKKNDKKKSPSGFAKPTPISSDLSNFLGIPIGDQIARTDVTSKVIAYVKEHNLQNPEDKKQIVPDAKLNALLQAGDIKVTFFNLQTHLKKHFLAPIPTVTVEPSVV